MDDLISRQAALEKVRTMQTYKLFMGDDMILVDKAEVQTELMMLPSAQPEPHWIPVEMELPEENERVLIYCVKCGIYIAKRGRTMSDEPVFWVQGTKIVDTAIAWMPLPKPFEGGAE